MVAISSVTVMLLGGTGVTAFNLLMKKARRRWPLLPTEKLGYHAGFYEVDVKVFA